MDDLIGGPRSSSLYNGVYCNADNNNYNKNNNAAAPQEYRNKPDVLQQNPVETKESWKDDNHQRKIPKIERKNLIIWDWDDTLFPTYAFRTHADKKDEQFFKPKLQNMVDIICEIFTQMIAIYGSENIIIVTNGSENWIHKCLNVDVVQPIYMKLQRLLIQHRIAMISASQIQIRRKYPTNPYKWKEIVFGDYFARFFATKHDNDDTINIPCITSIGDSLCEYKACDVASKHFKNRILNRILFKSNPSIAEMIFELRQILMMTQYFSLNHEDIDLDFSKLNPSFVSSSEDTPSFL